MDQNLTLADLYKKLSNVESTLQKLSNVGSTLNTLYEDLKKRDQKVEHLESEVQRLTRKTWRSNLA